MEQGRPAAFRRLCVETGSNHDTYCRWWAQPPSGGCVLKQLLILKESVAYFQPPSGGCVLKLLSGAQFIHCIASRLQAAVC